MENTKSGANSKMSNADDRSNARANGKQSKAASDAKGAKGCKNCK